MELKCKSAFTVHIFESISIYTLGIAGLLTDFKEYEIAKTISPESSLDKYVKKDSSGAEFYIYHVPENYSEVELQKNLRTLSKYNPAAKVILCSVNFSAPILSVTFYKGVKGYFLLSENPEKIKLVLTKIFEGEVMLSEKVMHYYLKLKEKQNVSVLINKNAMLNLQEESALEMLSQGIQIDIIRDQLNMKTKKWETFVKGIFDKIICMN